MKKKDGPQATIRERIDGRRKGEVLMLRANAPEKLKKHVVPTFDPETGLPDGGTRSAFCGDVCYRCGQTRQQVLETTEGKTCAQQRTTSWGEIKAVEVSTPLPKKYEDFLIADESAPILPTLLKFAALSAPPAPVDPLADVFA